MIHQNPTRETGGTFCAIRKRKPDGTPNVGGHWLEPMGSIWEFIDDQKTWEVIKYDSGDRLPA